MALSTQQKAEIKAILEEAECSEINRQELIDTIDAIIDEIVTEEIQNTESCE